MAQEIDPDARFERARQRAKGETSAAVQQRKDALKRKFAQAGLSSSGAAIKQEQLAEKQGQQMLGQRIGQIESAQEESALKRQQIEKQRAFQRGEREASQEFGAAQAEAQRKFARGERLSQQDFAALQAGEQRKFATSERKAGQTFQGSQAEKARNFAERVRLGYTDENGNKVLGTQEIATSQFAKQYELAEDKFELDEEISRLNIKQAEAEANKKDMFDRIGDLGTGAWKGWGSGEFDSREDALFGSVVNSVTGGKVFAGKKLWNL